MPGSQLGKQVRISVKNLHLSELISDEKGNLSYGESIYFQGLREVSAPLDVSDDSDFAEGTKRVDDSIITGATLTLLTSQWTIAEMAEIHAFITSAGAKRTLTNSRQRKCFAIQYEVPLDGGSSLFYSWLKTIAKFNSDTFNAAQSEDNTNYQAQNMDFGAIYTIFVNGSGDNLLLNMIDTADPDYAGEADIDPQTGISKWFDFINEAPTPFTFSTIPLNNAVGVALNAVIDITTIGEVSENFFRTTSITSNNIFVQEVGTNNLIAGVLTVSVDKKTVTFTPDVDLITATEYELVITGNVQDTFGQAATFTSILFTTV